MWFDDFNLQIELVEPNAKMPTRAHSTDAGCDIYTPVDITIQPHKDILVSTGWRCKFNDGYAMIIAEKSGISTKKKLDIGAKIVDSEYRGITHVHLFNNSDEVVTFSAGDKIAQFLIQPVWTGQPIKVDSLDLNTARGTDGFGSTGK